jgi:hypothetical protein
MASPLRRMLVLGAGVVMMLLIIVRLRSRGTHTEASGGQDGVSKKGQNCEAAVALPPVLRSCPVCSADKKLPPFPEGFSHLDWEALKAERDKLDGQYSGQSLQVRECAKIERCADWHVCRSIWIFLPNMLGPTIWAIRAWIADRSHWWWTAPNIRRF